MKDIEKEMLKHAFSMDKWKFKKCLEPSMQCKGKVIRAHTVQNSRVLDLLEVDGHVISFGHRLDVTRGPIIEYKLVGRNEATTFTGLCSHHDREIFKPIDTASIDENNSEQLFLLAYRSVIRELHATMEGAVKIQSAYNKRVSLGFDPKDKPSKAGMDAVFHMMKSWRTYRFKFEYDKIFLSKNYSSIHHETRMLDVEHPTFAASVLFSGGDIRLDEDIKCLAINVLPVSQQRVLVVISWLKRDVAWARQKFCELLNSKEYYFKYLLSKTILNYSDNFVLSPNYVDAWSSDKKDTVRDYFYETILKSDINKECEHLYLF